MAKIEEKVKEYRAQCKLAKELYGFLSRYNGYDVVADLDEYEGESLCIGNIQQFENYVDISRDYFTTYPPLSHDWKFRDTCYLIGLEYPEKDVVKILRKDGAIYIKGIFNEYRAKTASSVDIVPKNILEYGQKEFVDEIWSKKIDGKQYFVIDFFRAKKRNEDLRKIISGFLSTENFSHITKTMFLRKGNNPDEYEIGLWDIVNECPIADSVR